jgi:hypothetical protein
MKHFISISSFFLSALFVLTSCEKPLLTEDNINGQKADGNLTVSISQFEQTPFSSLTRTALSDVCTHINFLAYTPDGLRVANVDQEVDDPNFGVATFFLDEGEYQLVVVAHSSKNNPTSTDFSRIRFSNASGYTDTFFSSSSITIGEEKVDMDVSLSRIVALCRFVITDDYPTNVAKMRFRYTGGSGAFNGSTGFGSVNSTQTLLLDVTSGQKQFDLYTFLHENTGTIHLQTTAYDSDDNELYERVFEVPLEKNKITWLTGAYFSSFTTFSVNIDTDWAGEDHRTF